MYSQLYSNRTIKLCRFDINIYYFQYKHFLYLLYSQFYKFEHPHYIFLLSILFIIVQLLKYHF
jgi:hypothetical protein